MASTFKFHSQINETVPWQANYAFPTQSTKVNKQSVKLSAKTGFTYNPGQTTRIEFPADGYLNVLNSLLLFDVSLFAGTVAGFQRGGAHNMIKRLVVRYGSMVIEDIQEYKTIVRIFTEAGVQQDHQTSTGGILDGMSDNYTYSKTPSDTQALDSKDADNLVASGTSTAQSLSKYKRTYALNLMSGLLTSKKLIPLKWMASQLSIEITWASYSEAFNSPSATPLTANQVTIDNVQYLAEMLEFDSAYDAAFAAGLASGGVPIKFSSWHFHSFNISGSTALLQIHERSRSVKHAFAVMRSTDAPAPRVDSDIFFHDGAAKYIAATGLADNGGAPLEGVAGTPVTAGTATIDEFQFRVGGKYYPSQPVNCTNGAAEAFVELQKCLNSLGDYTRAGCINVYNWALYFPGTGTKFIMSQEFENTDVMPDTIAGINAEEQSDIALSIKFKGTGASGKKIDVFMHYDAMLIVKDNNLVDLVM